MRALVFRAAVANATRSAAVTSSHIVTISWNIVTSNRLRASRCRSLRSKLQPLFAAIEEMAAATREALGEARLAWMRGLGVRVEKNSLTFFLSQS